jgi:hypothetical protein
VRNRCHPVFRESALAAGAETRYTTMSQMQLNHSHKFQHNSNI